MAAKHFPDHVPLCRIEYISIGTCKVPLPSSYICHFVRCVSRVTLQTSTSIIAPESAAYSYHVQGYTGSGNAATGSALLSISPRYEDSSANQVIDSDNFDDIALVAESISGSEYTEWINYNPDVRKSILLYLHKFTYCCYSSRCSDCCYRSRSFQSIEWAERQRVEQNVNVTAT